MKFKLFKHIHDFIPVTVLLYGSYDFTYYQCRCDKIKLDQDDPREKWITMEKFSELLKKDNANQEVQVYPDAAGTDGPYRRTGSICGQTGIPDIQ